MHRMVDVFNAQIERSQNFIWCWNEQNWDMRENNEFHSNNRKYIRFGSPSHLPASSLYSSFFSENKTNSNENKKNGERERVTTFEHGESQPHKRLTGFVIVYIYIYRKIEHLLWWVTSKNNELSNQIVRMKCKFGESDWCAQLPS